MLSAKKSIALFIILFACALSGIGLTALGLPIGKLLTMASVISGSLIPFVIGIAYLAGRLKNDLRE